MNKEKLILITDGFPYGLGEKPFIIPELPYLLRSYDVTIVAQVTKEALDDVEHITKVSSKIRVLTYLPSKKILFRMGRLRLLFSACGWEELASLAKEGFSIGRLADSTRAFSQAYGLRRFMRRHDLFGDPSNTLFYSFWLSTGCLAVAMEKRTNNAVRLVSRAHGYDLYEQRTAHLWQPFQRFKAKMCDRIMFISKQGLQYFSENYEIDRSNDRYKLNYLGIHLPKLKNPEHTTVQSKIIVSCSNVIPIKRISLLIDALSLLKDISLRWIHFGDGPQLNEVRERAESYGIDSEFMGHVPNEVVLSYYEKNHVDVFVNVSESEGLPVSLMEAASYRIPLVATDVGGSSEVIKGNGVLLPPNPSPTEVADALSMVLCSSDKTILEMRKASRRLVEERFNITKCKTELLEILENV